IFVIVLLIFGPKALPKIAQSLGKGIRDFKDAMAGVTNELENDNRKREEPHVVTQQTPSPHTDSVETPPSKETTTDKQQS
ncbi:MAG: twin-arginine translocase TatA/TatE family subunit, partial [Candidatus Sumerlaeota bacterium]|nr:twin-arginine translocase TatA/TatE family subunit [Candidatus Sumerlaeota bacterium]